MADIDTSFYPRADSNSLVDKIGGAINVRNAMETNKLLQQQQVQGQIGIDSAKIDLAHKGYEGLGTLIGSLAQDPRIAGPEGPDLVKQYADNAVRLGYITPEQRDTALQTMPQDPAQMGQWLQTVNTQHLESAERFRQVYGTPGTITNGSQTLPVTTSSITGVRPIGAPIDQTLSPESRSEMVETKDAQGRIIRIPRANLLAAAGMNPMTAQPMTQPTGQENRLIPAQTPVERRELAPVDQTQNPPGGVVVSPPAWELESQSRQAAASADKFAQDLSREGTFQQDILPMEKGLEALGKLGPNATGPGTDQINDVKAFLVSTGIGPVLGIDPEAVGTTTELKKYLVQSARASGDVGTNDKLAAAFAGNPNISMVDSAISNILKINLSQRRMQNAQVRAFSASGENPAEYSQWATEFNATQDPVAYGFDMMDGTQRQKYFKGLSAPEKTKLLGSIRTATQLGVIAPPSAE